MRILHFYKAAYPDSFGGVETVIHNLASGMSKKGHQVNVLSTTQNQIKIKKISKTYSIHFSKSLFTIFSSPFSLDIIKKYKKLGMDADLIHYHYPWPYMDLLHLTIFRHKPAIVTYHSDIVRQKKLHKLYHILEQMFLNKIDKIISTSPNYKIKSKNLKKHSKKVLNINIGITREDYPPLSEKNIEHWKQKVGTKYMLFVGALRYYKGLELLVKSLGGTHHKIVIAGVGPQEKELKKLIVNNDYKNIYLVGIVSEVDKVSLIHNSYGIVFPSTLRSEAFGITLLEGALFEKPLISSELGTGTSFINIHKETGLVIKPNNQKELLDAIEFLYENESLAAMFGKQAYLRYKELFTKQRMVDEYEEVYASILKNDIKNQKSRSKI